MRFILIVLLFICTSFVYESEIETYIKSTGISRISHADFEIILKKVNLSKFEIEKLIIDEIEWDIGGFSIHVSVFSKKQKIQYYFTQYNSEKTIKYRGKEKIVDNNIECIGQDIDGVSEKKMYILPFSKGVFIRDSARYIICESEILKQQEWIKSQNK